MNARLAIGLGATAALVLLVALLSREPTPSSSAATPAASAEERQVRPAPAVEQPEEAPVVEPQVQPPSEPQLASPAPSVAAPRSAEPLEPEVAERLPEGWTPPPEEFGSVTVFVISRKDRKPFEGVLVWSEPVGELGRYEMPEPLYSDAEGKVTFERVPAGRMRVCTLPVGSTPLINVRHGENSVATVWIGTVLRAVEGVVLTQRGEPAKGAEIWKAVLGPTGDIPRPLARTDESGQFRIWLGNPDGRLLCARRGDELPSNLVKVPRDPIGTTERVEFVLGPIGQKLEVRVFESAGKPIENAEVWVSCSSLLDLAQWKNFYGELGNFGNFWRSTSDAQGVATLGGVPRGVLYLAASADGFATEFVRLRLPHPEDPLERDEFELEAITVTDGRFDLTLSRGVVLEGRVLLPDGRPAVRAAVRHGHENRPGSVTKHTDKDGYFRLHGAPTGACGVWARLGDYATGAVLPPVADGTTRWWAPVLQYDGR
ncbi:MAG: hypothetical protein JNN27_17240 [Planctomycetes bacterium]|nr:hypothetical protein [Planctomycetota bacterium]